ncbi:MAG: hypothetical protein OEV30_06590, partial [Ignavibacteria bacterium]|nr:hypothetical protein [Ignavibacteria bacterium]
WLEWWLLLVVLIGTLGSLRNSHLVNSTLRNMKEDPGYQPVFQAEVSPETIALIRRNIEPEVSAGFANPSDLAAHVSAVWTRISTIYPPIGVTILLLCVYGFCVLLGLSVFVTGGG